MVIAIRHFKRFLIDIWLVQYPNKVYNYFQRFAGSVSFFTVTFGLMT